MTSTGRKRMNAKTYTADDQALGQIAREAEAKLAAKRAARNEAREIRMRELEKQQKENEEKQDRIYELTNDIPKTSMRQFGGGSSRRGSEDSTTDEGSREMRSQLAELDEKYKKAMMGTAQLHNEKQALVYEVEHLKDQLEEREEEVIESQREFKDKCKELESKKRSYRDLETEFKNLKIQIEQRDKLIEENGLAIVISDEGEWTLVKASAPNGPLSAGLPTMGMVNSRLASEADTSLAQNEDFMKNKCIQTDPYRIARIVGCRPKATQTDEPDPASLRKAVDTAAVEAQTDDVPELLRAAIEHAEKITQTQSKPLEISKEEKYFQLIEFYKDTSVQTVESQYAPWTASHSIEPAPRTPTPPPPPPQPRTVTPQPRSPTPPPVVEIDPEEEEIEKLRAELNEDSVFDPSKFRKRMLSLTNSSLASGAGDKGRLNEIKKRSDDKRVDPDVGDERVTPVASVVTVENAALDSASAAVAPEVRRQESTGFDQIFEIVEDEPVFDSSRYTKPFSRSRLAKTESQPLPQAESKPADGEQLLPDVQRQSSVGFDQIFDVEEEPVFDPSRYLKRFSKETPAEPPNPPQPSISQPTDSSGVPKPFAEVQRQTSVGFDQIFDNEEDPVFDPTQYKKRFSLLPREEPQPPADPPASKPADKVERQESVGFDQIFDNAEEEPVFDPIQYKKRFSSLPQSTEPSQTPTKERSKTPCDPLSKAPPSLESSGPSSFGSKEPGPKTKDLVALEESPVQLSGSSPSTTEQCHLPNHEQQLELFGSRTEDKSCVPILSIPSLPPCRLPQPGTEIDISSTTVLSDSAVYDSNLSLSGSATDLHNEDRMSRGGRSSFDSTTIDHSKRYGSVRDLTSIARRNSTLTNGQRSILSREASPKLNLINGRANSLRSIYSPEPVTQNHSFNSRETAVETRSEPINVLEENQHLKAELKKLTDQLDEERSKKKNSDDNQIFQANGPEMQLYEIQREASKEIHEYKLKLQKAEQDIATLEGSVNRLDSQVKRYRAEAEDSEKLEDELKQEKRKLMRELREAQSQIEELRNHNSHLQKRLEKMKQSRSALVK